MAVYVVWSTQLGASEEHVAEATTLIPDPRVRHYWDPTLGVGRATTPHLDLGSPAWDVWLLFDRDVTWGDGPLPEPAWWEHQLGGLPADRHLDPTRFAERARELLRNRPTGPGGD